MGSRQHYSDLPERVSPSDLPETRAQHFTHEGLQTEQAEKERWFAAQHAVHEEKEAFQYQHAANSHGNKKTSGKRRCGLAPCPFWSIIATAVVVIIVAAAVGGVLGSISHDSEGGANAVAATESPRTGTPTHTGSATRTSSADTSLTTETLYAPDGRTLYRDCPSSNHTIYTYGSASSPMLFRKWCDMACYNTQGWTAMINEDTDSLDDCIDLCAAYNVVLSSTNVIGSGPSANGSVCNTVCWRWSPQDPDWPGHCFGFTQKNVSGHFNLSEASDCDSAGWMNQYF